MILVDAMVDAGRWDDAGDYLETLRSAPESTPADSGAPSHRRGRSGARPNDRDEALRCARGALAQAQAAGLAR